MNADYQAEVNAIVRRTVVECQQMTINAVRDGFRVCMSITDREEAIKRFETFLTNLEQSTKL